MTKSTKIGASIFATALLSTMALTSITQASNEIPYTEDFTIEINQEDLAAFEQELASLTDQDIQEIEVYIEANKTDEEKTEEAIYATISEDDWNTLSMKQIDDKLLAAGLEKIGDEANDPYYTKTVAELNEMFDNINDAEWTAIEAECDALFDNVDELE